MTGMTEIERKAQALLNEVSEDRRLRGGWERFSREQHTSIEAVCRALERKAALQAEFDQFRQDVSDAVEQHIRMTDEDCSSIWRSVTSGNLSRFILPKPKPDPLVEALKEAFPVSFADAPMLPGDPDEFRKALAARGLKIVEAE